ncbi:unnamed protein product [Paramecium sonneborni]|uniref:Uncharacterized protein n=1 Tax=Paramecium sonneborni TaxID=65129 RepID=A0A8S1K8W7_9CILI|nr:unnamed protein product [Paramecium sonneborni]
MQNDLNQSLNQDLIKQTIMVIGLIQAGKTTLVQKYTAINQKLFQESCISDQNIELIDTPSYDYYFTLLPFRDPKVTGYLIIFCEQNLEIMKSIKQIRKKLFQINGQHKRTIILFNEFSFDNQSSEIQQEIVNIKYWCRQQDIIFSQINVKKASSKEIKNVHEKNTNYIILENFYHILICHYDIYFSICHLAFNQGPIFNYKKYFVGDLLLSFALSRNFQYFHSIFFESRNQGFQQLMHQKSKQHLVSKSKVFSCLVAVISIITLIIASMFYQLLSCLIMSILFTFNSVLCLFYTFYL